MKTLLDQLHATSAGHAIQLMKQARAACLRASYHVTGGHAPKAILPAVHTVHIEGTEDQIESFKNQIGEIPHEES